MVTRRFFGGDASASQKNLPPMTKRLALVRFVCPARGCCRRSSVLGEDHHGLHESGCMHNVHNVRSLLLAHAMVYCKRSTMAIVLCDEREKMGRPFLVDIAAFLNGPKATTVPGIQVKECVPPKSGARQGKDEEVSAALL